MKENSRNTLVGSVGLLVISGMLIVGCASNIEDPQKETTSVEEQETGKEKQDVEVVNESDIENVEKAESDEKEIEGSNEAFADIYLMSMQDNLKGIADVTLDKENKMFIVNPSTDQFIVELLQMANGEKELDDWNGLVDSFEKVSKQIKEDVGLGYGIMMLNPVNEENGILLVVDGNVVYDEFNQ